ncbi:MAG: IclR family transcriptional regulator [Desulfovibrio sp.]|jgi:DNA-binding IclR family transcriptional regulator|nr:IclR family transcriptional regulator [Desulfovibrio sp.]
MALIEHLSCEGNNTGITAIAAHVGLHKSTCFGILHTLQELGYVLQNKETGRYSLGTKVFTLGQAYLANLDIRGLAAPQLAALSAESLETVHLVIRERLHAVYLDKIEAPHAITISSQVGQRARMHCTGVGKVILAHFTPEEQLVVLEQPLEKYTEYTLTDRKALALHLAEIKEKGLSIDNEEIEIGLCCIAAPIFASTGTVTAAISISGPKTRLTEDRFEALSRSLRKATDAISRSLGYQGPFGKNKDLDANI